MNVCAGYIFEHQQEKYCGETIHPSGYALVKWDFYDRKKVLKIHQNLSNTIKVHEIQNILSMNFHGYPPEKC